MSSKTPHTNHTPYTNHKKIPHTMNKFITIFFTCFLIFNLCRIGKTETSELPDTFEAQEQAAHTCADSTHALCDGGCECDGFECE